MAKFELDDRGVVAPCAGCAQKNRITYERLSEAVRCARCKRALTPPSEPIDVPSASDFDRLVARASVPMVVDFWAPWCGPCRMVAPELQKVATRQAGRLLVVKVNTDAVPGLGDRLGIRSIPTLAVFADGHEVARTTGVRPAAEIEAFVDQATHARPH
jgi:thioredoxin 2